MVAFELLVRPAVRVLAGHTRSGRPELVAVVGKAIRNPGGVLNFLRGRVEKDGGDLIARPSGVQGAGILSSFAGANALIVVPEGTEEVQAGAPVRVRLLSG